MPPCGVRSGTKRAWQYEHIKEGQLDRGTSEGRAEEIAARTVNKERARSGESSQRSRTSTTTCPPPAGAASAPARTGKRAARVTSCTTRPNSWASTADRWDEGLLGRG